MLQKRLHYNQNHKSSPTVVYRIQDECCLTYVAGRSQSELTKSSFEGSKEKYSNRCLPEKSRVNALRIASKSGFIKTAKFRKMAYPPELLHYFKKKFKYRDYGSPPLSNNRSAPCLSHSFSVTDSASFVFRSFSLDKILYNPRVKHLREFTW